MTTELAAAQHALIAALVHNGPMPPGIDKHRFLATRSALQRKRAASVARAWPLLAGGLGSRFYDLFADWAARHPPTGSRIDGRQFAQHLRETGALPTPGLQELAEHEARWTDHNGRLRRRWLPSIRRAPGALYVQVFGRTHVLALTRAI